MVIGIKDNFKWIGISVIACCAIFVCTLFLHYHMDLIGIADLVQAASDIAMYEAMVSTGIVVCAITGGCLAATSVILLLFYVKNYIDTHARELGILKALGYSNMQVARHFWVFGGSILAGCILGLTGAYLYMPQFYALQNADQLLPNVSMYAHPLLDLGLIGIPTAWFTGLSILYAYMKLRRPALDLLTGRKAITFKESRHESATTPFLPSLKSSTLRSKQVLVFFVFFSAFCFSSMTQMSMSMGELSSGEMALIIVAIGLILSLMSLILSLSSVIHGNQKTLAMMRVFGYSQKECSGAILGGYRPFSYLGFALGTLYQYALLKIMVTVVFADVEQVPEYHFDFVALAISLVSFLILYELILLGYQRRLRTLSIGCVMSES